MVEDRWTQTSPPPVKIFAMVNETEEFLVKSLAKYNSLILVYTCPLKKILFALNFYFLRIGFQHLKIEEFDLKVPG